VRSGRQKPSPPQTSPAAQSEIVVQPGRQRPSTQLSEPLHWALRVHSGVLRQKPLVQVSPEAQSRFEPQMSVQPLFRQARAAPHS
jgi:hypothetical protein